MKYKNEIYSAIDGIGKKQQTSIIVLDIYVQDNHQHIFITLGSEHLYEGAWKIEKGSVLINI